MIIITGDREAEKIAPPGGMQWKKKTKFIDLSHEIEHGLVTYPGLPAPIICDYLSREQSRLHYAPGTEFQIGRVDMIGNTGTYVDSPFHRFASGKSLAELPLES